jgi:hypothetical protein
MSENIKEALTPKADKDWAEEAVAMKQRDEYNVEAYGEIQGEINRSSQALHEVQRGRWALQAEKPLLNVADKVRKKLGLQSLVAIKDFDEIDEDILVKARVKHAAFSVADDLRANLDSEKATIHRSMTENLDGYVEAAAKMAEEDGVEIDTSHYK